MTDLEKEVFQFFNEPGSDDCRPMPILNPSREPTLELPELVHIFGNVNGSISSKQIKSFALYCDQKKFTVRINNDTVFQQSSFKENETVHIIGRNLKEYVSAKMICSGDYYDLFYAVKNLGEKLDSMKSFLSLPNVHKQSVLSQLTTKKYELVSREDCSRITSREQLCLKYNMCRETYSPQQQMEIENLLKQKSFPKGKADKKLEYILNINTASKRRKNVSYDDIMHALDSKLYKMAKVKEKIAECFVASKYTSTRSLRILLVGNPGTGKTTIARAIAEISGIPFAIINLNGVSTALELKGLDSSYDSADAGKFIQTFYSLGTSDAVIVLEEIDKLGDSFKDGNPAASMLDTLSDEHLCYDSFLEMSVDTSNTVYIATANTTRTIPDYLLNRFDVIYIDDYNTEDKIEIAKNYILPSLLSSYGISNDKIIFAEEALKDIVRNYCDDSGARKLKDHLKTIVRKIIKNWEKKDSQDTITVDCRLAEAALDTYVDKNDPMVRFNRNRDLYHKEVFEEIRATAALLKDPSLEPHQRDINTRRLDYLTKMFSSNEPVAFEKEKFFQIANESHYGLSSVKETIAKSFYVKTLKKESLTGEKFLFCGGPGIGKSSICKIIAEALRLPLIKISLNGVSDEKTIKGFDKTYTGSDAGEIIKGLARVGTTRAVVQLDEIDKLGKKEGVEISSALIDLLDDSAEFTDHFLGIPVDLSDVLFIATANDLSAVHPLLLDRLTVIELEGYTRKEKECIITDYLLPRLEKEYKNSGFKITMTSEAKELLLIDYCNSLGVRDAEKALKKILEDRLFNSSPSSLVQTIVLDVLDITKSLGSKPLPRGNMPSKIQSGLAKALAVTGSNSGMTFPIETALIPGSTSLEITGLPKDSAIDSVKIAKNYIKCHYSDNLCNHGLHLHFGEGAVVKDGPSAGVTILVSMLSAIYNIPIKINAAYTGEIDLYGNIFPIGGTKAKIQAAELSGCEQVFIPADNYSQLKANDLEQFSIKIIPVRHVSEVIDIVLPEIKVPSYSYSHRDIS